MQFHDTNASRYKVFSFMARDVFCKGHYLQHAIMQNERSETLRAAIETFKKHNSDWEKLQCVLVDKDITEISVLWVSLPNMRVLLCQFHVIKYLREEIASDVYGFTAWQKGRLKSAIELLAYTKINREYGLPLPVRKASAGTRPGERVRDSARSETQAPSQTPVTDRP